MIANTVGRFDIKVIRIDIIYYSTDFFKIKGFREATTVICCSIKLFLEPRKNERKSLVPITFIENNICADQVKLLFYRNQMELEKVRDILCSCRVQDFVPYRKLGRLRLCTSLFSVCPSHRQQSSLSHHKWHYVRVVRWPSYPTLTRPSLSHPADQLFCRFDWHLSGRQ